MTNYDKMIGIVKPTPLRNDIGPPSNIIMVGKKPYIAYSQYAFFRFQEGVEELTFKCCGLSILEGLKSIVTLSSLMGKDIEIGDIKLSQHVDSQSNIHTKIEITVINPNVSTSKPNSEEPSKTCDTF